MTLAPDHPDNVRAERVDGLPAAGLHRRLARQAHPSAGARRADHAMVASLKPVLKNIVES
jgi:hypothetical protein